MKPATLVAAALCVASVAAFAPKASGAALMSARSSRVAPPAMSMEVWSEKNIRLTLPLGVALPLAGLVTPPDSFGASVLPVAIAALWIFIFVDLLKAAVPQGPGTTVVDAALLGLGNAVRPARAAVPYYRRAARWLDKAAQLRQTHPRLRKNRDLLEGAVGLGHHHQVGELHDPALHALQPVARCWWHEQHEHVDQA